MSVARSRPDEAELQRTDRAPAAAHYLIFTYSAWGHTRPLLSLTLAFLLRHPHLTATLLIYDPLLPKCLSEITKWNLSGADRARLEISSFGSEATNGEGVVRRQDVSSVGELAVEAYAAYYTAHTLNPPAPTPTSVTPTPDAVRTSAIILDASIAPAFLARKRALDASAFGESSREEQGRIGGRRVKVLTFHPASSGYVGFTFFKDSPLPPLVAKGVADLAAGRKQSVKDVWEEIYLNNHTLVPIVGQEPVYMYELEPSRHLPLDPWLSNMHALQTLYAAGGTEIDGLIVAWPFDAAVQAASEATFRTGSFYQVGALVPPAFSSSAAEESRKEEEGQRQGVMGFLDRCADKEVLFISFGSIFFPPSTHQTRLLLDTLLETRTKFILVAGAAEPTTIALMREVLLASPSSDGQGQGQGRDWWFEQGWVDQLAILSHPSTSFFLTHAGSNSVLESTSLSIPLVLWPGTFDQPLIAAQLASLGVGVELLQVRLRKGMTARGVDVKGTDEAVRDEMKRVWEMIGGKMNRGRGAEGLRRRVRELGEKWRAEGEEGGRSWEAMGRLGGL